MSKPLQVTPTQMATAVSIIISLADAAMEGGKTAELLLGRDMLDAIPKAEGKQK